MLDANGEANVIFETTKQPGDNFRVALAFRPEHLNALQVSDPTASGFLPSNSDSHPTQFSGAVSPLLTVWRRLWCEFDSMGAPPATKAARDALPPGWELNHDEGVVIRIDENVPTAGQSSLRIHVSTNPLIGSNGLLTQPESTWVGGRIDVSGVGSYNVISATNWTDFAVVVIDATPGNVVALKDFKLYDDDVVTLGTKAPKALPYSLSGGLIMYTAYADAYIEPIKVAEKYIDTNVPFKRNLEFESSYYGIWQPVVSSHRDLTNTEDFWVTYLLCCWQGSSARDDDPDSEIGEEEGVNDPFDNDALNQGAIYIETIREGENNLINRRYRENLTVTHETGHSGRAEHDDRGIMSEGANGAVDRFTPPTIIRFREGKKF